MFSCLTQSHVVHNVNPISVRSVFGILIAINPDSQSQVVANRISHWITYLGMLCYPTVGQVSYIETQKFIFAEAFRYFSLNDTKVMRFAASVVISRNSTAAKKGSSGSRDGWTSRPLTIFLVKSSPGRYRSLMIKNFKKIFGGRWTIRCSGVASQNFWVTKCLSLGEQQHFC